MTQKKRPKTWKRELAVIILVWFMYVVEVKSENTVEMLVWPVFTVVSAAFGYDAFSKQLLKGGGTVPPNGGRSERSSQHTGGED